MNSTVVAFGTYAQFSLAFMLFMFVVFSAASTGNNASSISRFQSFILHGSMYILPLSCIASALFVKHAHHSGIGTSLYYWLYLLPIILVVFYITFLNYVSKA